jgi:hypothetical protein
VGNLRPDELGQIRQIAGTGLPSDTLSLSMSREDFVEGLKEALDKVYLGLHCPDPPCPKAG